MIKLDASYMLYSNCIPVKGSKRGIICDLGREIHYVVPNSLIDVVSMFQTKSISYAINNLQINQENTIETIIEYYEFLHENDIIYFTEDSSFENFIPFPLTHNTPNFISNADIVIELSFDGSLLQNVLYQLSELGCHVINIRLFNCEYNVIDLLFQLLSNNDGINIRQYEIYIPYSNQINTRFCNKLISENNRIKNIFIYGSPENIIIPTNDVNSYGNIIYYRDIINLYSCGIISDDYFTHSISHFTEALIHNTCLNKKVAIDSKGNIKNCNSMTESYGNISNVKLDDVVSSPKFQKLWNINKDVINICKNCEYRYICSDCRAFLNVPDDIYSQPLKCGYDPETNIWEEWSTNPIKQNVFKYYKHEL